jgi:hypothetical protein
MRPDALKLLHRDEMGTPQRAFAPLQARGASQNSGNRKSREISRQRCRLAAKRDTFVPMTPHSLARPKSPKSQYPWRGPTSAVRVRAGWRTTRLRGTPWPAACYSTAPRRCKSWSEKVCIGPAARTMRTPKNSILHGLSPPKCIRVLSKASLTPNGKNAASFSRACARKARHFPSRRWPKQKKTPEFFPEKSTFQTSKDAQKWQKLGPEVEYMSRQGSHAEETGFAAQTAPATIHARGSSLVAVGPQPLKKYDEGGFVKHALIVAPRRPVRSRQLPSCDFRLLERLSLYLTIPFLIRHG